MVASLRPILPLLLVLLQIAAPLVHAHVGGDGGISGLHVHTFEAFQSVADDQPAAVKGLHQVGATLAIVELGSAIQTPPTDSDYSAFALCAEPPTRFDLHRRVGRINFSPHRESIALSVFPDSHTSRAPPI